MACTGVGRVRHMLKIRARHQKPCGYPYLSQVRSDFPGADHPHCGVFRNNIVGKAGVIADMDLEAMETFARVIEARIFSGAARRMNVSTSVVSKTVTRLERALGA